MNTCDWNPHIRFARIKDSTLLQGLLQAVDHRLLYFHSGTGHMEAAGQLYPIASGAMIYLPAGTAYRFLFKDDPPLYSGFNFDFFQEHHCKSAPIPPAFQKDFAYKEILEKTYLETGRIPGHCIFVQNAVSFEEAILEAADEYRNHNLYYDARCSALLKDILILMIRLETSRDRGVNRQKADAILQYIHSNYHCSLTAKDLGSRFGYHENYISTLVLKHTGLTLHQYILHYRMQTAVGLLQSTDLSVTEVAEKVGMPDIKHFSKTFKKMIGHPPSRFQGK